jgi:hypothetical protein
VIRLRRFIHVHEGASLFVNVSGRSTVRDDRRLSRTSPDDFLEYSQRKRRSWIFLHHLKSMAYGMMHNDDWVAFMKESKSRFASYNAENQVA